MLQHVVKKLFFRKSSDQYCVFLIILKTMQWQKTLAYRGDHSPDQTDSNSCVCTCKSCSRVVAVGLTKNQLVENFSEKNLISFFLFFEITVHPVWTMQGQWTLKYVFLKLFSHMLQVFHWQAGFLVYLYVFVLNSCTINIFHT